MCNYRVSISYLSSAKFRIFKIKIVTASALLLHLSYTQGPLPYVRSTNETNWKTRCTAWKKISSHSSLLFHTLIREILYLPCVRMSTLITHLEDLAADGSWSRSAGLSLLVAAGSNDTCQGPQWSEHKIINEKYNVDVTHEG